MTLSEALTKLTNKEVLQVVGKTRRNNNQLEIGVVWVWTDGERYRALSVEKNNPKRLLEGWTFRDAILSSFDKLKLTSLDFSFHNIESSHTQFERLDDVWEARAWSIPSPKVAA